MSCMPSMAVPQRMVQDCCDPCLSLGALRHSCWTWQMGAWWLLIEVREPVLLEQNGC